MNASQLLATYNNTKVRCKFWATADFHLQVLSQTRLLVMKYGRSIRIIDQGYIVTARAIAVQILCNIPPSLSPSATTPPPPNCPTPHTSPVPFPILRPPSTYSPSQLLWDSQHAPPPRSTSPSPVPSPSPCPIPIRIPSPAARSIPALN